MTIIVLLILAGVTIATLTGENGILAQAKMAKEKTEEATKKEEEALKIGEFLPKWNGDVSTEFSNGDGSEENPYIIENAEQLAYFAKQVNNGEKFSEKHIKMIESINLNNCSWTPIGGNSENEQTSSGFAGYFDGTNKKIYGINVKYAESSCIGLFGMLEEGGTIANLSIETGSIEGMLNVGGISGYNCGIIENCTNKSKVTALMKQGVSESGLKCGGMSGLSNGGNFINCANYGEISSTNNAEWKRYDRWHCWSWK